MGRSSFFYGWRWCLGLVCLGCPEPCCSGAGVGMVSCVSPWHLRQDGGLGTLLRVEQDAAKILCVCPEGWMLPESIGGTGCACATEVIHSLISMLETPVLL